MGTQCFSYRTRVYGAAPASVRIVSRCPRVVVVSVPLAPSQPPDWVCRFLRALSRHRCLFFFPLQVYLSVYLIYCYRAAAYLSKRSEGPIVFGVLLARFLAACNSVCKPHGTDPTQHANGHTHTHTHIQTRRTHTR